MFVYFKIIIIKKLKNQNNLIIYFRNESLKSNYAYQIVVSELIYLYKYVFL